MPQKGFVNAIDLRAGDYLWTVNGEYVIIEKIQHEIIESPVKVYNFRIANNHTYFVGNTAVGVHNKGSGEGGGTGGLGEGGGQGSLKPELMAELEQSGVKYSPNDVVDITKTPEGKLVWLETGTEKAGLNHIILEHANDFANKGISISEIPNYIMEALSSGEVIGYQGTGTGRPIYQFTYTGVTQQVVITVGSNGYIVGANPR